MHGISLTLFWFSVHSLSFSLLVSTFYPFQMPAHFFNSAQYRFFSSMHFISVSVSNKWSWNTNSVLWHIVSIFFYLRSRSFFCIEHLFQCARLLLLSCLFSLSFEFNSNDDSIHFQFIIGRKILPETENCTVISPFFWYECTVQFHCSLLTAWFIWVFFFSLLRLFFTFIRHITSDVDILHGFFVCA